MVTRVANCYIDMTQTNPQFYSQFGMKRVLLAKQPQIIVHSIEQVGRSVNGVIVTNAQKNVQSRKFFLFSFHITQRCSNVLFQAD